MKTFSIPLILLVGTLLMCSCAAMRPNMPPLASIEGKPGHFGEGRIVDLSKGRSISFEALISELRAKDLIFVGEVHDNPEHHLMEVQILQALTDRYGPLTVAMEFFDTTKQPVLDRYVENHSGETAFLQEVDWRKSWAFPYYFYRPLVMTAKANGNRIMGINAPIHIVRKVARSGLDSLTPEERDHVADQIDLGNAAHRDYLKEVYEDHPKSSLKNFEHFYQAQCVWEDTMAENIAQHIRTAGGKTVVFAGNGHIIQGFGIPDRVSWRTPVNMAAILLYPLTDRLILNKNMADYIWLTGACSSGRHRRPTMKPKRPGEIHDDENSTGKN